MQNFQIVLTVLLLVVQHTREPPLKHGRMWPVKVLVTSMTAYTTLPYTLSRQKNALGCLC